MAYGDDRFSARNETFDSALPSGIANGDGDWGAMQWVSGGTIEPTTDSTESAFRHDGDQVFIPDQYATVTVGTQTGTDCGIGAKVRGQAGTDESCYVGFVGTGPGANKYLLYSVNSSNTYTLQAFGTTSANLSAGDTVTIEVEGTSIRLGTKEGVGSDTSRISFTDAGITTGDPGPVGHTGTGDVAQITEWDAGYIGSEVIIESVGAVFDSAGSPVASITANAPTGASQGDTLWMWGGAGINCFPTVADDTTNGPWVQIQGGDVQVSSERCFLYMLKCRDGAPDSSWTITASGTNEEIAGVVWRTSGGDEYEPVDVGISTNGANSASVTATGVTTVTDNSLVLYLGQTARRAFTVIPETEVATGGTGGSSGDPTFAVAAAGQRVAGATGDGVFTVASSANNKGMTLVLRPDQGNDFAIDWYAKSSDPRSTSTSAAVSTLGLATTNDYLIKAVATDNQTTTHSIGSDGTNGAWTNLGNHSVNGVCLQIWGLYCGTGAPDASHTLSWNTTQPHSIVSGFLRGLDSTTQVDASAVTSGAASGTTFTVTGVTTATDDALVLWWAAQDRRNLVNAQPKNIFASDFNANSNFPALGVQYDYQQSFGASGASDTFTSSVSDGWAGIALAFRPATSAAPVLTLPTETSILQTTATVGCTTDTADGTLYYYVSTSATPPSATDLKAGTGAVDSGSQASPGVGTETFSATGLSADTTYYTYFIHNNTDGDSNILESGSWATLPNAPVLTLPTETDITDTTATVGCTTNFATGTLYYYISTSATAPNATDLKAGTGAVDSGSQASPGTGTETFAATGLSASTTYYTYFIHNNTGGDSNILESGSWATTAAPPVLSLPTETDITQTTATIGCTTDVATGTLYAYVSTSATPPSSADLKSGLGAVWFGNSVSPGIGTETFAVTGLSASTTYYSYFIHDG